MENNTTGSNNIALGQRAGTTLTIGNNNIEIGNVGGAGDTNTIRIGTQGAQTATYIAGIFGESATDNAVVVSNTGKLGIVVSSARYKRDIQDMGGKSSKLLKLRPVSFRYKQDPAETLEYGLVAEEVAKVYPELVSYGPDGKPITVRYLTLISMLLNELQKQNSELRNQAATNRRQGKQLDHQAEQIKKMNAKVTEVEASFEQRLSRLEQPTQAKASDGKLAAAFSR